MNTDCIWSSRESEDVEVVLMAVGLEVREANRIFWETEDVCGISAKRYYAKVPSGTPGNGLALLLLPPTSD